jgi:hypothetical protein
MSLAEVDELDLWRGEAVAEKMVRMRAAALGGMGGEGEQGMAERTTTATHEPTAEERRLSEKWYGARVTQLPPQEMPGAGGTTVRRTTTRFSWGGANKPR